MRRPNQPLTKLATIGLILTSAACQELTAPEPVTDPKPAPALRRNADVVLRRIDVEGGCDGNDILGDPKKGHFQYKIRVRENAVGAGKTYTKQSKDYGKLLGQTYLRGPGGQIDLDDYTYTITALSAEESVSVYLYGTEWDTVRKDSYMDGISHSQKRSYPGKDGTVYYELNLGKKGCKIELEYAIRWSTP